MMGITRYTRILALFDEEHPAWTVADISAALDTSASTLYRLIREMVAADFLESTVESRYRLGPFFVEYYRRLRLTDSSASAGTNSLSVHHDFGSPVWQDRDVCRRRARQHREFCHQLRAWAPHAIATRRDFDGGTFDLAETSDHETGVRGVRRAQRCRYTLRGIHRHP